MVIWHLKQIGNVKKFGKWVPYELTKNFKNCHFEVLSSPCNKEPFLDWIMTCDLATKKWILYNQRPTRLVVGQRRSSQALPKAKLASKEGHSHCLVACCRRLIHYSFLKLLHLRSIVSKSMRCTENRNTCNQCWPTDFSSTTMLGHPSHHQCFKS